MRSEAAAERLLEDSWHSGRGACRAASWSASSWPRRSSSASSARSWRWLRTPRAGSGSASPRCSSRSTCVLARIEFPVGGGNVVPTHLVLFPMLVLMPPAAVPRAGRGRPAAGEALGLGARRRDRWTGALFSIPDAWHAVGPALVLVAAGAAHSDLGRPSAADRGVRRAAASSTPARRCCASAAARGIAPTLQFRVFGARLGRRCVPGTDRLPGRQRRAEQPGRRPAGPSAGRAARAARARSPRAHRAGAAPARDRRARAQPPAGAPCAGWATRSPRSSTSTRSSTSCSAARSRPSMPTAVSDARADTATGVVPDADSADLDAPRSAAAARRSAGCRRRQLEFATSGRSRCRSVSTADSRVRGAIASPGGRAGSRTTRSPCSPSSSPRRRRAAADILSHQALREQAMTIRSPASGTGASSRRTLSRWLPAAGARRGC